MRIEHWFYTLPLRLRSLFRRSQVDHELTEELSYHLDQKTDQFVAAGMPADEARHAAFRSMGGLEQRKEQCRDTRKVNWLQDFLQDFRYAARTLSQIARLHRRRHYHSRPRHRRQLRHLFRRRRHSSSPASLPRTRRPRAHLGVLPQVRLLAKRRESLQFP